jgi:hypothetical protein
VLWREGLGKERLCVRLLDGWCSSVPRSVKFTEAEGQGDADWPRTEISVAKYMRARRRSCSRHGTGSVRARSAPAAARSGRSGPPASRKGRGTGARWPGAGTRDHEHEGFRGSADGEHGEISPRGLFVLRMTPEDPGRPLSRYLPFNKWMSSLRWTVMNSLPPGRRIRLSSAIHASARSSIRCRPDRGHERMPAR